MTESRKLEDRTTEITLCKEQEEERIQRREQNLRDLWTLWKATKYTDVHYRSR